MLFAEIFEHVDAGDVGHFPIEKNDVVRLFGDIGLIDHIARGAPRRRRVDRCDGARMQDVDQQLPYQKVIVGDQYLEVFQRIRHSGFQLFPALLVTIETFYKSSTMPPLLSDRAKSIVIATHNNGKLQEFSDLLKPYALNVVSAGQLGLPSPEETGVTFAENALLKARAACGATGMLALADDSGLCVNALDGQPGIYSARWAEAVAVARSAEQSPPNKEPSKDFNVAMQRIQNELGDAADRSAYFICVLALVWPDGRTETVEGRIDGVLALAPRGTNGHGYDPIFIPDGETRVFAEMGDDEKNAISHRGKATRELVAKFFA